MTPKRKGKSGVQGLAWACVREEVLHREIVDAEDGTGYQKICPCTLCRLVRKYVPAEERRKMLEKELP